MSEKLTPPDLERCQTEWTDGSFMTLGKPTLRRCAERPLWIAKEKKAPSRGRSRGSMSVCASHRQAMEQQIPGHAKFTKIRSRS